MMPSGGTAYSASVTGKAPRALASRIRPMSKHTVQQWTQTEQAYATPLNQLVQSVGYVRIFSHIGDRQVSGAGSRDRSAPPGGADNRREQRALIGSTLVPESDVVGAPERGRLNCVGLDAAV